VINAARVALGASIVGTIAPDGSLAVITLDAALEGALHESLRDVDGQIHLVPDPAKLAMLQSEIEDTLSRGTDASHPIALVCSQMLRRPLRHVLATMGVDLPVVAYPELPSHVNLIPIGVIGHAARAST
jgi:flagellar biosynthesis component FlhA